MAVTVKGLRLPSGAVYNIIGKTWYGTCSTSSSAQTKNAIISGFTSADREVGTRVIVKFSYPQSYNGTPKLSINGTVAANISAGNVTAGRYEWNSDSVVAFVYDGNYWVIEDGGHATTTNYGKALLVSSVSNETSAAISPAGVQDALITIMSGQYSGDDSNYTLLLDTTTPSSWQDGEVIYTDTFVADINSANTTNRIIKVTYGDRVVYIPIAWSVRYNAYEFPIYENDINDYITLLLDLANGEIELRASANNQGAHPFKVEYYYYSTAGFVTYPLFKDTIGDIETLLASI